MKSSSMGTRSPIVLAMLVAGIAATAAAAAAATNPIRLPGGRRGAGGVPWECCNSAVQDSSPFRPLMWQCNDVVAECPLFCHECEESPSRDGYVCRDWIFSLFQPPACKPRPWDCCDVTPCTRTYIPYCICLDEVESCTSNCKTCELAGSSDPPSYRCLDGFHGDPGPKCTPLISKKGN